MKRILALKLILLLCIFTNFTTHAQKENLDLPIAKDKKILMVHGGWQGHRPAEFVKKMKKWLEAEGAVITVSDSLGVYNNAELLGSFDLIIQYWTMGKISKTELKGLQTAIKNGVGFTGVHGGIGDSFRESTDYQYMVGGQWTAHPGGEIDYSIHILDKKNPITKGISDYPVKTEQYYMLVDPNVNVIATTTFDGSKDYWNKGAVMPVAWTKYFGKGRIFYFSVGHSPNQFEVEETMQIIKRGFRWASESKYKPFENLIKPVYKGTKLK